MKDDRRVRQAYSGGVTLIMMWVAALNAVSALEQAVTVW